MTSNIDTKKMFEFCRIPVDQLEGHPDEKLKLRSMKQKTKFTSGLPKICLKR